MIARNISQADLDAALAAVNRIFMRNIIWNRKPQALNKRGDAFRFTLRVKDSKRAGARRGHTGRRMVSACWHVHGHFFEALIAQNPDAVIFAAGSGRIDRNGGNWHDRNIGGWVNELMYSEACDCGKE